MGAARRRVSILQLLALFLAIGWTGLADAARMSTAELPAALRDWVDWVMFPDRERQCPFVYNRPEERRCSWATSLELQLDDRGGTFRQQWAVQAPSWATLPGDVRNWPQEVRVDEHPAVVGLRNGRPAVHLGSGQHQINGRLAWNQLPESLPIPEATALLKLSANGVAITEPQLDSNGNVWLHARPDASVGQPAGNHLALRVFRRVIDEIPLQLVTRIELDVSGAQREEMLSPGLPEGFIPLALNSTLPVRLENDGRLRLRLRPGSWTVELVARSTGPVAALTPARAVPPWPAEEVWSFDARPELRLVEVSGASLADPAQTGAPPDWRSLPAYLIGADTRLALDETRRGDPQPAPDALTLHRDLWLDFDGGGYTIRDRLGGTVSRSWRMTMNPPTLLGQAMLDGERQLITADAEGRSGVEVRRGQLDLVADSRYDASRMHIPATGWQQDFQQLDAVLHLPPGWRLFSAGGVDSVPQTWIRQWTLLDIFLVLIAALAIRALWNWRVGLLALLTFTLIWHEPGAPRAVWLHLLAAIALLRVIPAGGFRWIVATYRNLALVALVLYALPFMVEQLRSGLYPQLEGRHLINNMLPGHLEEAMAPSLAPQATGPQPEVTRSDARASFKVGSPSSRMSEAAATALPDVIATMRRDTPAFDPDALLQTGPGLPDWQWRDVPLGWNGPVQHEQELRLVLLSPRTNLLLAIMRVGLLALLAAALFGAPVRRHGRSFAGGAAASLIAVAMIGTLLAPRPALAELPDPALLEQLHERLSAPPDCLPDCAQFPRLRVELTSTGVVLRAEIHAFEATAIPLPVRASSWNPAEVSVDGVAASGLQRARDGGLWLHLTPGVHQVLLRGSAPAAGSIQFPLPLVPRHIEVAADGWNVEGVANGLPVGGQLQFTRIQSVDRSEDVDTVLPPFALPPLVRVERTLHFDIDWRVETRVTRISPPGTAVMLRVPLLPGEAITSEAIRVENGEALVNLAADAEATGWRSTLEISPRVMLETAKHTQWFEVWRADVGPAWHMEHDGIAVVHHQDPRGRWLPEWRPWPGEGVELTMTRPPAVPGTTLTLDAVELRVVPGQRATDTTTSFRLRSSRGGQHTVHLADGAVLQSVVIDGVPQPIRQEGTSVTLPLTPGTHVAELVSRDDAGIEPLFRTPVIDAGLNGVNTRVNVSLAMDRWVLLLGGLPLGPAVLFWGVLVVVVLVATGLGRLPWTPLRTREWLLLGVGLTQTSAWVGLVIAGWLLALGGRTRLDAAALSRWRFNLLQIALFLLTLFALAMLFEAIKHGLLGYPEMQIAGNGSTAWDLRWYQDRSTAVLPRAWILSVPLWVYRALMLGWALWLAFALLRWLRKGWEAMNQGGLWRAKQ